MKKLFVMSIAIIMLSSCTYKIEDSMFIHRDNNVLVLQTSGKVFDTLSTFPDSLKVQLSNHNISKKEMKELLAFSNGKISRLVKREDVTKYVIDNGSSEVTDSTIFYCIIAGVFSIFFIISILIE